MTKYEPKMAKNALRKIIAPYFLQFCTVSQIWPFKVEFLCERYSHCIYSSCSTELTKTRNTWSLTAVINKKASLWRSSSKRNTTKQQGWGPSLRGGRTFPERQLIQTDVLLITRGLPSSLNWNPMDHLDFTSK